MDIDALHSTLLTITLLSERIRRTREEHPPQNGSRDTMENFWGDVERDLNMAKATLAGELGFALCPDCWPPELISTDLTGSVSCPGCGKAYREWAA